MHKKQKVESFTIAGISVRTFNRNNEISIDLGVLWERFYLENIRAQIPNRLSDDIYCVYTDYESDYTGKYTAILGYKVPFLGLIPQNLTGCIIDEDNYSKYTVKGGISSVTSTWLEIWNNNASLDRKYTTDFDVYKNKSIDIDNAEIDIFIAAK